MKCAGDSDATSVYAGVQRHRQPGAVMGMLLVAVLIVEVPKYVFLSLGWQEGALVGEIIGFNLLMAAVPFALARLAPTLADFDLSWLPTTRSQWFWFFGLVILLLTKSGLCVYLISFREDGALVYLPSRPEADVAPVTVILLGVAFVLTGPIAEEIFWRGFLLPQLTKLTAWPIALSIHSLLFSLFHIPAHWSALVVCFFYGILFGLWRLRFRSLVPLILAHMILNGVAVGPRLVAQYNSAVQSHPKSREIDRLKRETAETAVPALIAFMADRNEGISFKALETMAENFHSDAQPYLAQALNSSDDYLVDRALFAIEWFDYSDLAPQVEAVVWSHDQLDIQLSAVITLWRIGDEQGLNLIAEKHPETRVRRAARECLQRINGNEE